MDITMSECKRNNLCIDCDDTKCWLAGKLISDCPHYHCIRPAKHIEDCEHCEFLKQYQEDMRRYYKNMLWEIVGRENSEFEGIVFGHFTSEELANKGLSKMSEELHDEVEVRQSNLGLNTIEVDGEIIYIE